MAVTGETASAVEAVANEDCLATIVDVIDTFRQEGAANVLADQVKKLCVLHGEAGGERVGRKMWGT